MPVKITLTPLFRLVGEKKQWVLEKKIKSGWKDEGYYNRIGSALKDVANYNLRMENKTYDLESAIRKLGQMLKEYQDIIEKAGLAD